ncbi:hypothetical protein K3495_g5193 [Podosphaera aphanis]|nr:hypothetical protein K3495_g5193 [Podosphaera aphanis]
MPKLLSALTGKSNSATLFEIRLKNDIIVLHGDSESAPSQLLAGVVVLSLHQTMKVEEVYLRMSGSLRISWPEKRYHQDTETHLQRTCEIFHHKWAPFVAPNGTGTSSKGSILHPGKYEWPFDLIIPGSMAESVEGLPDTNLIYRLKAVIVRGKLSHDLYAEKRVRIVRTLDSADSELTQPISIENIWPNKVEYSVMVPQKAVMLGTAVEVEMKFATLLKGLQIGNIKCQICEMIDLTTGYTSRPETLKGYKTERIIGTWNFQMTDESYQDILFENGQDGHILTEQLPLPKTLNDCLQDCDIYGIKVRHKIKFNISLHNPDGHLSELRATIPITILSSCQPPTVNGELINQTLENPYTGGIVRHAPPLYGDHVLDQPYADTYSSDILTPAVLSGMTTPVFGRSRNASCDNLASLDGTLSPRSTAPGAVPPAALSSRLQNISFSSRNSSFRRLTALASSGTSTPHLYPNADGEPALYFDSYQHTSGNSSGNNSGSNSTPLSRRGSGGIEDQLNMASSRHPPKHIDLSSLEELSKVPSYRTVPDMNNDDLPNYEAALSKSPSPTLAFSNLNITNSVPIFESRINGLSNAISTSPTRGFFTGPNSIFPQPISDVVHERRRFSTIQSRGRSIS